jgi:alkaline phosphatase D
VLGEEQWRWLESELRRPAELRLLFTSVQVLAVGHGWERWGNVPSEVSRLFSLIRSTGASGVVLVSGDRHQAGVYAADAGDGGAHPSPFGSPPYTLHELTSSSLTHSHRSDDDGFTEPDVARIGSLLHQNNFGTVAIDWARRTVTLDIRTSDECGLSAQPWDAECEGEPGARANEVLASLTLQIDQLSASSAQI